VKGNHDNYASIFFQRILNTMIFFLGIILSLFLVKKTIFLIQSLALHDDKTSYYYLVEGILVYFLYFEFLSLVVKYFQNNNHFPLRYFIYIAVTAIVRLIIVNHEEPMTTFVYTLAILTLIISLLLANLRFVRDD
jgi:protein PsiE